MSRLTLGNMLRIGGYFLSMAGLLVLFLADASDDDEAYHALAMVGCFAGIVLVFTGVFVRYWPESEASIRKRVEREQQLHMQEYSPRGTRGNTGNEKTSSDH